MYRSVKRQLFDRDSQYRQGQLEKKLKIRCIFIWSQGLVPQTVHTKGPSIVCGTSPQDLSHEFKLVTGTKFWSLRLHFLTKMGSAHEGAWSPGPVAGTSRKD